MKQAILITAYRNFHHLEEILHFFDDDFNIYIHIDKKTSIHESDFARFLPYSNLQLISQKYKVNWGGWNHLKSILFLAETALNERQNQYFHLISGHDFPIKKRSYFKEYFEKNKNKNYINSFEVPFSGWGGNGGLDRIEYYNLCDLLNMKNARQKGFIDQFLLLQKKFGYKRSVSTEMPKLYGGSTWWSLSRECLEYVTAYTANNKKVLNRFKHTFCSEEFYFPTVVMNSHLKVEVINNSLRHIDWIARNGNNPAILDESDYQKLTRSDAFFARKFEYPHSEGLLNELKSYLDV